MRKKVIIDCDAGVDDALALILAFHSPELGVKAVTGVNGNVPVDLVFQNIQKVLSLLRPAHKPIISKGADRPLKGRPNYAYSIHGRDGLGEARIDLIRGKEWWEYDPSPASETIIRVARQYPNEITLVATAPLTNLALALQKDLEGMKKLKEVVIMGGAVRREGNVTPYAEFNIFTDPQAARIVFESGLPIRLVPLDVTHQVFLTPQLVEEKIRPMKAPSSRFLMEATGYDFTSRRFQGGSGRFYLHDPLAVAVAADPTLLRTEKLFIGVETREGEHSGQTFEIPGKIRMGTLPQRELEVCLAVDSERFLKLFLSRL